mmetsp:Transcript_82508/g.237268  ORF Transcript_82508/g.237268 Transcript_82508/m.237268 type:complete len:227 (-) Transcript_82508:329-1009(-)
MMCVSGQFAPSMQEACDMYVMQTRMPGMPEIIEPAPPGPTFASKPPAAPGFTLGLRPGAGATTGAASRGSTSKPRAAAAATPSCTTEGAAAGARAGCSCTSSESESSMVSTMGGSAFRAPPLALAAPVCEEGGSARRAGLARALRLGTTTAKLGLRDLLLLFFLLRLRLRLRLLLRFLFRPLSELDELEDRRLFFFFFFFSFGLGGCSMAAAMEAAVWTLRPRLTS